MAKTTLTVLLMPKGASVAYPTGLNLTMGFDPIGKGITLLDPDSGITIWGYDTQNRIMSIVNPANEITSIQWDALDWEQRRVLANGMAVSHTFDPARRETLLENRNAAGLGLAVFTNSYDAVGSRLTVLELDGTRVTFGYDPTCQLIQGQRSGTNAYSTSHG